MKKKRSSKLASCILCIVLIVAMALVTTGCNGRRERSSDARTENNAGSSSSNVQTENDTIDTWPDGSVIGEGSREFTLTVADEDGNETKLEIHTDQETVGAALKELGVIEGDEGEYGLYVKKVNGITADYDKDSAYWAFYINGEYAQTGVDAANITEGDSYAFKIEKG